MPRPIRLHRRSLRFAALLAVFACGVAAGGALSAHAQETPRVRFTGEPPARDSVVLQEAWRAGGEDQTDVLLGQVGVVRSGPGGEVYALDTQLAEVQVFGPGGEHRRTLGREGDGPGEFRQPVGMFLTDGGEVAVQQAFPGRIAYLDAADGTPTGTWRHGAGEAGAGGFVFLETARARGGAFVVSGASSAFDLEAREIRDTRFLAVLDGEGEEIRRLHEHPSVRSLVAFTIDELAEYNPGERGRWDIGPDGRIYLAPRYDAYEIAVLDARGEPLHTIARPDYQARERTEQEKEDKRGSMQIDINGMQPRIDWQLQDRAEAIERIRVLDDGSLWVRHSRSADRWAEHGEVIFDVFDPAGQWLREVTVTVPDGGEGDRLVLLDDGRFLLVKGMASVSISVSAGDDDSVTPTDEELGDVLLELVCYERPAG